MENPGISKKSALVRGAAAIPARLINAPNSSVASPGEESWQNSAEIATGQDGSVRSSTSSCVAGTQRVTDPEHTSLIRLFWP